MQQPTLVNVRVSSTRDALQIFYAVARRVLPMITRRLDAEERRAIGPGNVYIWEERCANAEVTGLGMERWTDGISWSASRIAQEFLFYRQRDTDPESSHPRSEVDRLIKQTFSVHVSLPDDRPRGVTRKWHLTAYFSQATLDSLNTIDMIPGVGDVSVPPGWFKNARASKGR
ncbi:Gti1/Pac2 family-domain-containing protein, partial [Cytidiella melzeri]